MASMLYGKDCGNDAIIKSLSSELNELGHVNTTHKKSARYHSLYKDINLAKSAVNPRPVRAGI
ncbi:hypothetical protein [Xenorhabdus thuongxuanensis]|uniref:Uncharacterized protein n=1 Tax=Xenorhabdus thuongxuanensis TaxID=1873484 RepID=A0A1Q5U6S2_9GAMM|nr:hypothetical protein [Xenorhabdus thuongxuanensis]OKP08150.1 hypothetical protein Xentx_00849 [Xenorhabdus thuongxuanensis]